MISFLRKMIGHCPKRVPTNVEAMETDDVIRTLLAWRGERVLSPCFIRHGTPRTFFSIRATTCDMVCHSGGLWFIEPKFDAAEFGFFRTAPRIMESGP